MSVYLDSSAIVKLVQHEDGSATLRRYLRRHKTDARVTSVLARVEVIRALLPGGEAAVAHGRRQLSRLHQIALDADVLDRAALLAPETLIRTLDAIHVASAQLLGAGLRALVTYDQRMVAVAAGLHVPVATPL